MFREPIHDTQRVTRYNLVIAFEELYTIESAQLDASANAIGEIISTIQQLIAGDTALQVMLAKHHLTFNIIAPERIIIP